MDWFFEHWEVVTFGAGGGEHVHGGGLAGEEQDAALGVDGFELDAEVDAVESGHHDVGDEEVGAAGLGGLEGGKRVGEGLGFESGGVQDGGERGCDEGFIVHNEGERSTGDRHEQSIGPG